MRRDKAFYAATVRNEVRKITEKIRNERRMALFNKQQKNKEKAM